MYDVVFHVEGRHAADPEGHWSGKKFIEVRRAENLTASLRRPTGSPGGSLDRTKELALMG